MAKQQKPKQVILSPNQLPCTPHTTYYSNLFVLKNKVVINGQQAELAFSEDGELTLNCRYPSTKCLTLNYHTISADLEGIFRKYGVNRVNNSWCELVLYFQVSFLSQESAWTFLRSQMNMEIELSTLVSRHLPVSDSESCSPLVCEVDTELFLITVDAQNKDAWVEAVGEANCSACMTIWKESAMFDFGSLFQAHQLNPGRALMKDSPTLVQLVTELADVVEWFSLGLYLGVPEPELLKIEADQVSSQGRTERCKTALLSWCLKNGELSWSAVVRALEKIKMTVLAQKTALKYGVPMLQPTELEQPSAVTEHPTTAQEDKEKEAKLTTAASSLDTEIRKKVSLGKRHAQETQKLAESSSKIRRLTNEQDERRRELEKKEQEVNLYIRLQHDLQTPKDIECLKVKIARKKEKIKQLKAQLDRVETELSQAREESKQLREQIQQTTVKFAVQCEKTRNLKREVVKLKRERKVKDKQVKLSVARNQVHLSKLRASTNKEMKSLKQEIEEKDSTIRELSSQMEVKKAEEKELEEGQLAQMAVEISDLRTRLEEAEDGKMRAEEELKDLQDAEMLWQDTSFSYPHQQPHNVSFGVPPTSTQSQSDRVNINVERGPLGFGFSLDESSHGPVVKQIMDHPRCGQLKKGDIILEINGESTRNYLHSDLLTVLEGYLQATFTVLRKPLQPEEDSQPESVMQQMVATQMDNRRKFQHGCQHDGGVGTQISADFEPGFQTKVEHPDKPGKPQAFDVTHHSLQLKWSKPKHGTQNIQSYTISYRSSGDPQNKWHSTKTSSVREDHLLTGLAPKTVYFFKVRADTAAGFSPASEVSDPIETKPPPLEPGCMMISKPGEHPVIYQLPFQVTRKQGNLVWCTIGRPLRSSTVVPHKVLMLVGAAGAGKSTLINRTANYIYGVRWEDDHRLKLISDEGSQSQACSQTECITSYTFHHMEGSPLPYTLTVIDTPGFGDTEGVERDKKLVSLIKEFFSSRDVAHIDYLNAIGLVVQASLTRLTPTQRYTFDAILSMFGKDMGRSIFLMTTFADGQKPPVLEAVKSARIPHLSYFKFNNSALFADKSVQDEFAQMFWKMGVQSFMEFFKALARVESQSLQLTRAVLEEREQLEKVIRDLQPQIHAGMLKLEELRKEEQILKQHEVDILANKDFTYQVDIIRQRKVDLPRGTYTMNCLKCNFTCHENCPYSNDEDKYMCSAMSINRNTQEACCGVCPGKCSWMQHKSNPYRFEIYNVSETRISADLKARYESAISNKSQVEALIAAMNRELVVMNTVVLSLVRQAKQSMRRLEEISLTEPNSLTEVQDIDLLIESEKQETKPGFIKRVEALQQARRQAEIMSKLKHEQMGAQEQGKKMHWLFE